MFDATAAPGSLAPTVSKDAGTRLLLYAGTAIAYLCAAPGDPLAGGALAFLGVAAAWSLTGERRYPALFFPPGLKVGLIVAGSIVLMAAVVTSRADDPDQLPRIVSRFLLWNGVVFVLSRAKTEHDLWIFAIIDLSFFMIGGTFHRPEFFLVALAASMALLLWTFHRAAGVRAGSPRAAPLGGKPAWSQFRRVLLFAVLVFLLFPRRIFLSPPHAPDRRAGVTMVGDDPARPTPRTRTGLSRTPGHLDMSGMDEVKNDPTPVLGLRLYRGVATAPIRITRSIYLRQETFDSYDGRGHWTSLHPFRAYKDAADGKADGKVELKSRHPEGASLMIQQIRLIDPRGMALPAMPEPDGFTLSSVLYDGAGVFLPDGPAPAELEVFSWLPPSDQRRQVEGLVEIPPPPRSPLPLDIAIPRIAAEARRLADPRISRLAKVEALEKDLLSSRYRYTLAPPPFPEGGDPLESFVARGRAGYCVHFAGALTLLCRAAGLPSRMASGLLLGPDAWDESQKCYIGRNSDAHAWTEVWFGPEQGWIIFDPTPATPTGSTASAGPGPLPSASPAPSTTPDPSGTPSPRWDRALSDYDGSIPEAGLRALGRSLAAVAGFLLRPAALLALLGFAAAAFAAFRVLPRRFRSRIRQRISGFPVVTSVDFYQDFLWAAAARGMRKSPGQTPAEFAEAATARLPRTLVDPPTRAFYRVRYGGERLAEAERRTLFAIAREIEAGAALTTP